MTLPFPHSPISVSRSLLRFWWFIYILYLFHFVLIYQIICTHTYIVFWHIICYRHLLRNVLMIYTFHSEHVDPHQCVWKSTYRFRFHFLYLYLNAVGCATEDGTAAAAVATTGTVHRICSLFSLYLQSLFVLLLLLRLLLLLFFFLSMRKYMSELRFLRCVNVFVGNCRRATSRILFKSHCTHFWIVNWIKKNCVLTYTKNRILFIRLMYLWWEWLH